ncbi:MAG: hypothetical protein J2P22_13075 [Nocardioides sp.]|nr:hypothetical protein [Nocardioides sp.]
MTIGLFVLMLSIPVVILAKRTPFHVAIVAVWGFFLGLTPIGPQLAHLLNTAGVSIANLVS